MTFSDPQKDMLDTLREFRNVFGEFELKVTLPQVTLATPGYPIHTEYREYSSQPWDHNAKSPQHAKVLVWARERRAKK